MREPAQKANRWPFRQDNSAQALVTVGPLTPIREAARIMRERKIDGLPVVEDDRLVGIITTSDALAATTGDA